MLEQRRAGHHRKGRVSIRVGVTTKLSPCSAGSTDSGQSGAGCLAPMEPKDNVRLGRRRQRVGAGVAEIRRPARQRPLRPGHRPLCVEPVGRRVVGSNGAVQPITSVQFLVGAVAHPFGGNDFYVYYGQEQTQRNAVDRRCGARRLGQSCVPRKRLRRRGRGSGHTRHCRLQRRPAATCTANVQRVQEITVGFWQDIYKGDLGRVRFGAAVRIRAVGPVLRCDHRHGLRPLARQQRLAPEQQHRLLLARYYPFN